MLAAWLKLRDHLSDDLLGGPRFIKAAWVINLQKGATLFFVLGLMWLYDVWTPTAWTYAALHGSYGLCWLLKDRAFPDPSWEKRVTVGGAVTMWALVLGPYWIAPVIIVTRRIEMPAWVLAGATLAYVLGVALMMGSDGQKHFTLRARRGLITDGFFARIRHPNYLGEMILYASFAVLAGHWLPWAVLAWVWLGVFVPNMLRKEASMSRYPEWPAYKARTGFCFPRSGMRLRERCPLPPDDTLRRLCEGARAEGAIAIDLEFQRERTFWAKLCLVQLATRGEAAIVDPLARGQVDLGPLLALIADPAVEVVLHAGGQDLEILYRLALRPARNVFDTQIAAALLGLGEQVGYGALVNELLGVKLEKLETRTDWTRRPLTPAQTAYALDDVRYLLPVRDELRRRLGEKGRLAWLAEETAFYERTETYEPDPREAWRRVSRVRSLEGRSLAILRELAAWREETAREVDEPRGRIAADEVLIDVARRAPRHVRELAAIRGLHPGVVDRDGAAIIAAVAAGVAAPPGDGPGSSAGQRDDPEGSAVIDLLELVLRLLAVKAEIAPSYLGSRRDIAQLVEFARGGSSTSEKPALLRGWRLELAGTDLLDALAGRTALHIDPASGQVVAGGRA